MSITFTQFIEKWSSSAAAERANKDAFLLDVCDALSVPRPNPSTGDPGLDTYAFERDAQLVHEGDKISVGHMDMYKEGCFILEAKQGSEKGSKKLGTARRGSTGQIILSSFSAKESLSVSNHAHQNPDGLIWVGQFSLAGAVNSGERRRVGRAKVWQRD